MKGLQERLSPIFVTPSNGRSWPAVPDGDAWIPRAERGYILALSVTILFCKTKALYQQGFSEHFYHRKSHRFNAICVRLVLLLLFLRG
jgi:hypothetical protein